VTDDVIRGVKKGTKKQLKEYRRKYCARGVH